MSGNTPELALKTAVDADDNADYLTIALASSLTTLDALFSNTTGHTHSGAHQGGPIGSMSGSAIADGSITSAKIQDGTIATADLANASVTNAKLASDTARANLLTNGGFEVWQRGNGPFNTNGVWAADRWQLSFGAGALSVLRDTANVDIGSQACAAVTYTHSSASFVTQTLADLMAQLRGRTISFSLRVRTSTANAVRLRIDVVAGATTTTNGPYHTGGGAYETLTVTASVATNATVVNVYVQLDASCTAYLDNAMLVIGNVAADYAPLHPADDLARCLRYYELDGEVLNELAVQNYGAAGQVFQMPFRFKTQMALTPTVTKSGTWGVTNCSQPGASAPGRGGFMLFTTVTAAGVFQFTNNAGGTFFSSEANP